MSKLVVTEFMSLDGIVEDPGGEWVTPVRPRPQGLFIQAERDREQRMHAARPRHVRRVRAVLAGQTGAPMTLQLVSATPLGPDGVLPLIYRR